MPRLAALLLALTLLLASAPASARIYAPEARTVAADGPAGRFLLGGEWRFRLDAARTWTPARVPHAWNAGDDSPASMIGGVGWYRKDFRLPRRAPGLRWMVRFESVNYRMTAYLNGREIGRHAGAYLPFELPLTGARRRGRNRLEVRVDSRRRISDFPPATINSLGVPAGGWFNSSGILREVYVRAVDGIDLEDVVVRPTIACRACAARIELRARVRNLTGAPQRVRVRARFGREGVSLGTVTVRPGGTRAVAGRTTLARPRLWEPASPNLYPVRVEARGGGLARWSLRSGVRSIAVRDGRLYLNSRPMSFRGVGFHEDVPGRGMALTPADTEWLVTEAKDVGATVMRTHYPPSPYLHELADRRGMLIWDEVPVYQVKSGVLVEPAVRARALDLVAANIAANGNHPSVLLWSIANELSANVGPSQGAYIRAAVELAHVLDPTRPVGLAVAGYPSVGCQEEYGALDVLGINDYFGWYPGPGGVLFDREGLGPYLDQVRECYPREAMVVTEFGAEANREGPVEEKGTYGFQREFVDYHLGVFATKPWLSGASYWALNEFRVRPAWEGGNPRPAPPVHQKGIVSYDRSRKPAWHVVRRWYTGRVLPYAPPYPPARR